MTRYPSAAFLQETSNLNVTNHWILLFTSQSFSGIPPFCLILLTLLRRTNCCFHDRICKVSLHKERSKAGGTKFVIQHVSSTFGQHLTHCFSFLFLSLHIECAFINTQNCFFLEMNYTCRLRWDHALKAETLQSSHIDDGSFFVE